MIKTGWAYKVKMPYLTLIAKKYDIESETNFEELRKSLVAFQNSSHAIPVQH